MQVMEQQAQKTELLTMRQAGELLGGSRGRANWFRAVGRLKSTEIDGKYYATRRDVERLRGEMLTSEMQNERASRNERMVP